MKGVGLFRFPWIGTREQPFSFSSRGRVKNKGPSYGEWRTTAPESIFRVEEGGVDLGGSGGAYSLRLARRGGQCEAGCQPPNIEIGIAP